MEGLPVVEREKRSKFEEIADTVLLTAADRVRQSDGPDYYMRRW